MEEKIREDIISVLDAALDALKKKESTILRELSDRTIHNASIFQDKDSISMAVVMYALSKIIDRMASIDTDIIETLQDARKALEESNTERYEDSIRRVIENISNVDRKMDMYIQKVINEAEIKKGSRMYEHGISLAQTAKLLGITQWELMKYLGQTKIADSFDDEIDVNKRLEHTRSLFGIGM